MDMDFAERLKGFDKVWQRVQKQKGTPLSPSVQKSPQAARKKPASRARRFDMGR